MHLASGDLSNPKAYWEQRSDNDILNGLLDSAPAGIQNEISNLIESGSGVTKRIWPSTLFSDLSKDDKECSRLYSYLVMTGYLRAEVRASEEVCYICSVLLPNRETKHAYDHLLSRVRSMHDRMAGRLGSLMTGLDSEGCTELLNFHLGRNSVRDPWGHDDCKKWLLSLMLNEGLDAYSERESGNGYPDITVRSEPAVFVEITTSDEARNSDLDRLAEMSLAKATERRYSQNGIIMAIGWDRKFVRVMLERR
jgi:hypothetical protein